VTGRLPRRFILSIITGHDAVTLRETVDLPAAHERLAELGELRSLSALNEKVDLFRLTGQLDAAWDVANQALRQARFTGNREDLASCRIRRARVAQFQGKLEEAAAELTHCVLDAETHEWTLIAGYARANRGRVYFEQNNLAGALADFTAAVTQLEQGGAGIDELEGALTGLTVVEDLVKGLRDATR
jgi:tetratricopeptide (TPR) repeat protein